MSSELIDEGNKIPTPDSTPVGEAVKPCEKRNFIIILGGPGKYNIKDPAHDKLWGNYIIAAQHLFGVPDKKSGFIPETSLLSGECVHWLVYEKAYVDRWSADNESSLLFLKEKADEYSQGYLARIREYVALLGHKYVGIDSCEDIWETLYKLPNNSLTRMYYFGHGGPKAFYMRWAQDFNNPDPDPDSHPGVVYIYGDNTPAETISYNKIDSYGSWLALKAKPSDGQVSKFYACSSSDWAKKWHDATGLKSQGAERKITFKNIFANTLRPLESDDSPGWTSF